MIRGVIADDEGQELTLKPFERAEYVGEYLGRFIEERVLPVDWRQRSKRRTDHPYADGEPVYDVTFENVQAGLRYDYLFRLANHRGGIVVGTGDLSELALGWCTYGVGDQMSHYNVNAGVPKTLVQHLIRWVVETDQFATSGEQSETNDLLREILQQEITPELIPATAETASVTRLVIVSRIGQPATVR